MYYIFCQISHLIETLMFKYQNENKMFMKPRQTTYHGMIISAILLMYNILCLRTKMVYKTWKNRIIFFFLNIAHL